MSEPKRFEMNWPKERFDQLDKLKLLIREVATINNGNRCLERIAHCIELAKELDASDRAARQSSFVSFLDELSIRKIEE